MLASTLVSAKPLIYQGFCRFLNCFWGNVLEKFFDMKTPLCYDEVTTQQSKHRGGFLVLHFHDTMALNEKQEQKFFDEQNQLGNAVVPLDGERFPWAEKKTQSDIVAGMYADIHNESKAWRVCMCGKQLAFKRSLTSEGELGARKLYYAKFCRARLCPMCAARLSLKHYAVLQRVVDALYAEVGENGVIPIFLTLTVRNCKGHELPGVIDGLMAGWQRLTQRKTVRDNAVHGWFRTLEVTYNKSKDEYHPHFHAIGFMRPEYWQGRRNGGWAISQEQWRALWQHSARLDYDPSVDVRGVGRTGKSRQNALKEVAKYSVKSFDYVRPDAPQTSMKVLRVFDRALKGRRLFAMTGRVKDIAAELGLNPDSEDLIHIDEQAAGDGGTVVEIYQWFRSARLYAMTDFGLTIEQANALLGIRDKDIPIEAEAEDSD